MRKSEQPQPEQQTIDPIGTAQVQEIQFQLLDMSTRCANLAAKLKQVQMVNENLQRVTIQQSGEIERLTKLVPKKPGIKKA